jgi:iron complex outermembrane receptor protein
VRYVDTVFFRDHNENSAEINNLVDGEVQTGLFVGNSAGQDAHTKVNVGILYASSDNDFNVDFYINNLTNEMTKSSSSVDNNTALGFPGRYSSPRTWGMRINVNF